MVSGGRRRRTDRCRSLESSQDWRPPARQGLSGRRGLRGSAAQPESGQMMKRRIQSERGAALIFALMAMTVLMALGAALVLITSTETIVAGNFRTGRQAFYAAEAAVELASPAPQGADWTGIVAGRGRLSVRRRRPGRSANAPDRRAGRPDGPPEPRQLQCAGAVRRRDTLAPVRLRAAWRFRRQASASPFYIVAFVSGRQTQRGARVTIRAEAFGPRGAARPSKLPSRGRSGASRHPAHGARLTEPAFQDCYQT